MGRSRWPRYLQAFRKAFDFGWMDVGRNFERVNQPLLRYGVKTFRTPAVIAEPYVMEARPFHIVTPSDRHSGIIPGTLGEVMVRIDVNVRSLFRY